MEISNPLSVFREIVIFIPIIGLLSVLTTVPLNVPLLMYTPTSLNASLIIPIALGDNSPSSISVLAVFKTLRRTSWKFEVSV